jgi:hypothetical protein
MSKLILKENMKKTTKSIAQNVKTIEHYEKYESIFCSCQLEESNKKEENIL